MTDTAIDAVVVDTNVVSYLLKSDTRADLYQPLLAGRTLVISFMTAAELERWALERNWGPERLREMEETLRRYVLQPFDRELCRLWARVADGARRRGRPISVADAWIAATALYYDIPLVTHNVQDFSGVDGLRLLTASSS